MARPSTFKQVDVSRAVRATKAAGLEIARIDIAPDGRISVVTTALNTPPTPDSPFDAWKAKQNARSS